MNSSKSQPNRKVNEGWFERYMEDWCRLIDSNEYDVVTGWLQTDCLEYLLEKGYNVEVVVVDCTDEQAEIYKQRSVDRGNSAQYWNNLKPYLPKTLKEYSSDLRIKTWVFKEPIFLSDFLIFTGSHLVRDMKFGNSGVKNYAVRVHDMIGEKLNSLTQMQRTLYTNLVLSNLEFSLSDKKYVPITDRQVHDAWVLAESYRKPFHDSCIPFYKLSDEIKQLDTPYTNALNEVLQDVYRIVTGIALSDVNEEKVSDSNWYLK